MQLNMVQDLLPATDVLFTKDTLIHLPIAAIHGFLRTNVLVCPRRYKYVIFVQDTASKAEANLETKTYCPPGHKDSRQPAAGCRQVEVLNRTTGFHKIDMALPPFSLPVVDSLRWFSGMKAVQVLDMSKLEACPS